MDVLARLEEVAKIYPRVHRPGERLRAFGAVLAGREPRDGAEVLSGVSLEVFRGQSVGIIGENGAGKSTLLKVLTGVIQPSRGCVELRARTAALLELGAGFQPEDIGEYIHEPIKHYSSGMVVRLGFAVVTASRPELLITDEVLAVGDESFQKKCIRWLQGFLERGGTLLMVSHSMYLVQKLCQRALWLQEGRPRQYGDVFSVTQEYLAWHEQRNSSEKSHRRGLDGKRGHYRIAGLELRDAEDDSGETPLVANRLTATVRLFSPDQRAPVCLVGIVRADGTPVYGVGSDVDGFKPVAEDGQHYRYSVRFHDLQLLPGHYHLQVHAMDPEGLRVCDTRELAFRVGGKSVEFGFVRLPHEWIADEA
jgi:lipopolysaccharide transport system ATP-binding protein